MMLKEIFMKRKTLVAGLILSLALIAACGKKTVSDSTQISEGTTEVSTEIMSSDETGEPVSNDGRIGKAGRGDKEENVITSGSAPSVIKKPAKEMKKTSFTKYNNNGELVYKIDYDEFGHPTYEYDNETGNEIEYTYKLKNEGGNDVLYKYAANGDLVMKLEYYGKTLNVHIEIGYYNGFETYKTVYRENGDTLSYTPYTDTDTVNEYDSNGQLIRSEMEGEGFDTYSYTDDGQLAEQKGYNENGELLYTLTNEYDEAGNMVKGTDTYTDGSTSSVTTYKYDENGYLSEIYTDYGDGEYEKDVYVYDANGLQLEYKFVAGTKDGETEIQRILNEYDEYGHLTHEVIFSMGSKLGEKKYVYTYDSNGNVTKKETYSNDELLDVENYGY